MSSIVTNLKNNDTIKIKLSGDYDLDVNALNVLSRVPNHSLHRYRLDANQAYELDSAYEFFSFLRDSKLLRYVDYVEQPLGAEDWEGHEQLLKNYADIPIMLDESIVTTSEIVRAHKIGVPFVKLKLFKQGGILELLTASQLASDLNMGIVLGNGVATKISNRVEIELYHRFKELYHAPLEANGFLKIHSKGF
nr:enolase C-terminal domain-like protein [Roseivirga sp. E12]